MARRGHTLVEILVAAGLLVAFALGVHGLLVQGNRQAVQLQGGLGSEQDLRAAMLRMSRELQEAVRLLHPIEAGRTVDGIGFVTGEGELVFYHLEGTEGTPSVLASTIREKPLRLLRLNYSRNETKRLVDRVNSFRVTVSPPLPGKALSGVTLHLSVLERDRNNGPRDLHVELTRIFLRNLERSLPDE